MRSTRDAFLIQKKSLSHFSYCCWRFFVFMLIIWLLLPIDDNGNNTNGISNGVRHIRDYRVFMLVFLALLLHALGPTTCPLSQVFNFFSSILNFVLFILTVWMNLNSMNLLYFLFVETVIIFFWYSRKNVTLT